VSLAPSDPAAQQKSRMLALETDTDGRSASASIDCGHSDPGADPATIPAAARNRYLEAALDEGDPSKSLKAVLEAALGRSAASTIGPAAQPPPPSSSESRDH